MKLNGELVTKKYLYRRNSFYVKAGYPMTKWIYFCTTMIKAGFTCYVYEARQTNSKYVTVTDGGYFSVKIRFSDHKPIYQRELAGDCDFFVGVTHTGVRTTEDAIDYVMNKSGKNKPKIQLRKKDSSATISTE